jgi:hypothetical protein
VGTFTTVGGVTRNRVACINKSGVLQSWNPDCNGGVTQLAIDGDNIYMVGDFTTVGGVTRNRAACINKSGVLQSWNPNLNNTSRNILVHDSKVYLGGSFTTVGGVSMVGFACLDKTTGSILGQRLSSDVSATATTGRWFIPTAENALIVMQTKNASSIFSSLRFYDTRYLVPRN